MTAIASPQPQLTQARKLLPWASQGLAQASPSPRSSDVGQDRPRTIHMGLHHPHSNKSTPKKRSENEGRFSVLEEEPLLCIAALLLPAPMRTGATEQIATWKSE